MRDDKSQYSKNKKESVDFYTLSFLRDSLN